MEQALLTYKNAFLGQFFVVVSFICYVLACFVKCKRINFLKTASICLVCSYCVLTYCFIISDFSIKSVLENSALTTPLIYKIVGVWGSGSGSFLLWLVLLSFAGFILNSPLSKRLFAFHMVGLMALQYMALSPFETVGLALQNYDLTPSLQDHAMVLHPPILYLGQVFWAYIFFRNFDTDFRQSYKQRFIMVCSGFFTLTFGIFLGSYWAYYSLGWGGYWAWDPVEVISLWGWAFYLFAFHLLHRKKQEKLLFFIAWPVVLCGVALVRSGALASIHSFAENQYFIIPFCIIFALFIGLSILCAQRAGVFFSTRTFLIKRFNALWYFYLICFLAAICVLIVSVILPTVNKGIFFSEVFYKTSLSAIILPLLVFMSLRPYCFYLKIKAYRASFLLLYTFLFLLFFEERSFTLLSAVTLSLCCMGIFCSVLNLFYIKTQPLTYRAGLFLGHLGWFILIISSIFVGNKSIEEVVKFNIDALKTEKVILKNGYQLSICAMNNYEGKNYSGLQAKVMLESASGQIFLMETMLKNFMHIDATKAEMGLAREGFSEHMVVFDKLNDSILFISYYKKVGIVGVWLGACFMLCGIGLLFYRIKKYHEHINS